MQYGLNRNVFQFNTDEINIAKLAYQASVPEYDPGHAYVRGFPRQVWALLGMSLFFSDHPATVDRLMVFGRGLSVFYAALTIVVTYLLAKEILRSWEAGFWAALFLSACSLHVTNSHFCTADVTNAFWLAAVMVLSLNFLRKPSPATLILCSAACGFSIATKLTVFSLIPLVYSCVNARRAKWLGMALPLVVLTVLFVNGLSFSWHDYLGAAKDVFTASVRAGERHFRLQNPLVYFIALIPGLGSPAFAMMCWRGGRGIKSFRASLRANAKASLTSVLRSQFFWVIFLPLALYCLVVFSFGFVATRHMVVLTPGLASLAAGGLTLIRKDRLRRAVGFASVAYCFVNAAGNEYWYAQETRAAAWDYIRENIRDSAPVHFSRYMPIPEGYTDHDLPEAEYLVVHESYYRRYIRSLTSPFRSSPKDESYVVHGKPGHLRFYTALLQGKSEFRLVKRFRIRPITPESILSRSLFGWPPDLVGDVRIYRRS